MGRIFGGKCPCCGYKQQFYLEGGLMSVNLQMSAGVLPEEEQNVLNGMIESQEVAGFHVENYIAECGNCHGMTGKTVIRVEDKDGRQHIFGQKCSQCGKRMKIYWENVGADITCPECREGVLAFEEEGLWD